MASKQPVDEKVTDDVIVVDPEIPAVLVVDTSSSEDDSDESDVEVVPQIPPAPGQELPKPNEPIRIDEEVAIEVDDVMEADSSVAAAKPTSSVTLVPAPEVSGESSVVDSIIEVNFST